MTLGNSRNGGTLADHEEITLLLVHTPTARAVSVKVYGLSYLAYALDTSPTNIRARFQEKGSFMTRPPALEEYALHVARTRRIDVKAAQQQYGKTINSIVHDALKEADLPIPESLLSAGEYDIPPTPAPAKKRGRPRKVVVEDTDSTPRKPYGKPANPGFVGRNRGY